MSESQRTKTDENQPRTTERLEAVLELLTFDQMRFVVARQEHSTDKEAAESLGIKPATVKDWKYKGAPIDEAVRLMGYDGLLMAQKMRKKNLAKAMAVKVAGLDSNDERMRQGIATEIIEWEMGRASQLQKIEGSGDKGEFIIRVVGGVSSEDI